MYNKYPNGRNFGRPLTWQVAKSLRPSKKVFILLLAVNTSSSELSSAFSSTFGFMYFPPVDDILVAVGATTSPSPVLCGGERSSDNEPSALICFELTGDTDEGELPLCGNSGFVKFSGLPNSFNPRVLGEIDEIVECENGRLTVNLSKSIFLKHFLTKSKCVTKSLF